MTPFGQKMQMRFFPCSAELISTAYQPWNNIFFSQQISHSWLISQNTACRTGLGFLLMIEWKIGQLGTLIQMDFS
jgi:hypothetical protein